MTTFRVKDWIDVSLLKDILECLWRKRTMEAVQLMGQLGPWVFCTVYIKYGSKEHATTLVQDIVRAAHGWNLRTAGDGQ